MIEMPEDRGEERAYAGDPRSDGEAEAPEPRFSRGATDLVVSLAANGRTVRLFTADGDSHASMYDRTEGLMSGLGENGSDR